MIVGGIKVNRELGTMTVVLVIVALAPAVFHDNSYVMHLLIMSMPVNVLIG